MSKVQLGTPLSTFSVPARARNHNDRHSLQAERVADRAALEQLQQAASEEARRRGEGLGDVRGEARARQATLLSDLAALAHEVEGYRCARAGRLLADKRMCMAVRHTCE